ncbi:LEC14B-like protein [Senna tora]|uniref:LEC14B-like protein n=1 Tax=Senna tora TaxID=362788 RepID=A0A834T105_9FABA|nr:LEC14B-like protein [Senna tora]
MSRFHKNRDACFDGNANNESSASGSSGQRTSYLDHEIAQLTKLRSGPHKLLGCVGPGRIRLPVSTVRMLVGREGNYSGRGRFSSGDGCHVLSRYLPINGPWMVDRMKSRAYVSQFSADGSLFIAGFQGSHIRVYDVDRGWTVLKDISARNLRWTITDTSLSPDQNYLVYASMSPIVHIVNVGSATRQSIANVTEIHYGLNLSSEDEDEFGIFSVKFSTDGRELVAATSDCSICVYDLGADKLTLRIPAHMSDVNTVCFADDSGHLIYSGSDDSFCKVWDRRCLGTKGQPAGILMGHLEGITFIDSRGDGRYLISNGKDQTTKLWDIRKMSSNAINPGLGDEDWDYRWMDYPPYARNLIHPHDQSLATYKGHSVLRTLIRCYFSPSFR